MRSAMDQETYLGFYKSTALGYSNCVLHHICTRLQDEHRITYDRQYSLDEPHSAMFFENKRDYKTIVSETAMNPEFSGFYEAWEFSKLYKYSVPLFYEMENSATIREILGQKGIREFQNEGFIPEMVLNTSLNDSTPTFWTDNEDVYVKFVLQKSYVLPDTFDRVDYRYPIIIRFDERLSILEIRYDAIKYSSSTTLSEGYEQLVNECVNWLTNTFNITLFFCDHADIIKVINEDPNSEARIYKQMMELSSGASAELTASGGKDYVLPFIGEIRELIDEYEEVFNHAEEAKNLLLRYLDDKEATANYPYIYVKWINPVESQSYIVRVTFDCLNGRYTLLQHITGSCKDLGMGRMNNAIKYLCTSSSFTKGEKV